MEKLKDHPCMPGSKTATLALGLVMVLGSLTEIFSKKHQGYNIDPEGPKTEEVLSNDPGELSSIKGNIIDAEKYSHAVSVLNAHRMGGMVSTYSPTVALADSIEAAEALKKLNKNK